MSHHITLNSWFGSDQEQAAEKIARVFRMGREQGNAVLQQLKSGMSWQFEQKIPDHQAGPAAAYLQSIGFHVDLKPIQHFAEASADAASDAMESEAENEESLKRPRDASLSIPLGFLGNGGEFFGILFINQLKTILTLGIYHFWAKTRARQYIWTNTTFAGDHFSYHGTGKELFRGFVKFLGILFVIGTLLGVIQIYGGDLGQVSANLVSILLLGYVPVLMVGAWRYRLSRTAWRGIRFSFRGEGKEAAMIYLKGSLLTLITLGLYWPYFRMEAERFWRGNCYFGHINSEFSGEAKEIFAKYVLALFLTVLTGGIYWIWFQAYLKRYCWSHTHIGNGSFRFSATGGEWFVLKLVNGLLLLLTLGLGYSWVAVRNHRFFADHLTMEGDFNVDFVVQEMKKSGAFGEEALDAFDIPVDIG